MRHWFVAGLLGSSIAFPAGAAEIALVIGNDPASEDRVAYLAEVLNARGYEVYQRRDADRAELALVLNEVEARIGEAERMILFFAGETRSSEDTAWLLPDGAEAGSRIDLEFEGVRLEALLRLAAERPGRAAVVIGSAVDATGEGLGEGVDRLKVPQGVLLVAGETRDAVVALTDHLLVPDTTVAEARGVLDGLGLSTVGFASPDTGFAPPLRTEPEDRPVPTEPAERPAPAEPEVSAAKRAEQALGLDQAERRRIQENLTVLARNTRGIDGIFGPGTRTAIAEWQREEGFEPTGFLDAAQRDRLNVQAGERSAELLAEAEAARRTEEEADAAFWRTTGAQGGAADMRAYLDRYPDGIYAGEARAALDRIEAATLSGANAEDRADWQRAEEAGTTEAFRTYLAQRPEGAFAEQARRRVAELERGPERERREAAARELEQGLGLNDGSRALIETQLAALGFEPGEADGEFNRQTRRAIRQFQTRQGLQVTGFIDQDTVQALIVASLGLN